MRGGGVDRQAKPGKFGVLGFPSDPKNYLLVFTKTDYAGVLETEPLIVSIKKHHRCRPKVSFFLLRTISFG